MFSKIRSIVDTATVTAMVMTGGAALAVVAVRSLRDLDIKAKRDLGLKLYPIVTDVIRSVVRKPLITDCKDCGEYGHGFMLKDETWTRILTDKERDEYPIDKPQERDKPPLLLCLKCCEERLSRTIHVGDLTDVPINRPLLYAYEARMEL